MALRKTVPAPQLASFDAMDVCYYPLVDQILDMLPKTPDRVFLVPVKDPETTTPFVQTVALFKALFKANKGKTFDGQAKRKDKPCIKFIKGQCALHFYFGKDEGNKIRGILAPDNHTAPLLEKVVPVGARRAHTHTYIYIYI